MRRDYLGPYRRVVYRCRVCGKKTWAELAYYYRDEELTRPTGGEHWRQMRGTDQTCEEHCSHQVFRRLRRVLKAAGYTDIGRDGFVYEGNEIFSMILWFKEPKEGK